jgi:hypothetical protein
MDKETERRHEELFGEGLWAEVHLPDADPEQDIRKLESIRDAVANFLFSYGYAPDTEPLGLITHGSWHWKEWFRRKKPRFEREAEDIYGSIKEALVRQNIDVAGGKAFYDRAAGAATLIEALKPFDNAVVRLGDVIVAKAVIDDKPVIVVQTISPVVAREWDKNGTFKDPVAVYRLLTSQVDVQLVGPAVTDSRDGNDVK